jgi:serine/threonine protein phosphatase PrpC
MVEIESAGMTDVGRKRKGNEDALYVDDQQRLFIVADGMGGHQAGEVASALTVETIRDHMQLGVGDKAAETSEDGDETLTAAANRLLAGIRLANRRVYALGQSRQDCRGMGSTVSAALITDDTLIAANVGDSPIYLMHAGGIEQLSVTHNVISEQSALDPDAARHIGLQYRHMLTRAIGIAPSVEADVCEIQIFAGDTVVIGSDGLSDKVAPEEILSVVSRQRPAAACRQLVDLANSRGGDDNITVLTLKIRAAGSRRFGLKHLLEKLRHAFGRIFN